MSNNHSITDETRDKHLLIIFWNDRQEFFLGCNSKKVSIPYSIHTPAFIFHRETSSVMPGMVIVNTLPSLTPMGVRGQLSDWLCNSRKRITSFQDFVHGLFSNGGSE